MFICTRRYNITLQTTFFKQIAGTLYVNDQIFGFSSVGLHFDVFFFGFVCF